MTASSPPAARYEIPELSDTRTQANLRSSFQFDAQAAQISARFARLAEIEGLPEVARTFRELSESQAFQAQGHLDLLWPAGDPLSAAAVGETSQNLQAAMAAHAGDGLDPLPDMTRTAHAEGFHDIASWFETCQHVRKAHLQRLQGLLDA